MVVSLDKFTAAKIFDKVQILWKKEIKELHGQIAKSKSDGEKNLRQMQLEYMRSVEMAVIVSEEADEDKKFPKQKLDIHRHRELMNKLDKHGHDVECNFKDPEHPLQLVFVCAIWLTGFDAPTLSTLYLDKPMKGERYANHILCREIWCVILEPWDSTWKQIWRIGAVLYRGRWQAARA
jgi:type I restriction enzyme R subunit